MPDKSHYLPLAQVQRMFAGMPDGYNKYLEAYPGIDADMHKHVRVDPDNGAFMVAPPPGVTEQIRSNVLAKQAEAQLHAVQTSRMMPAGSPAAAQGLTRTMSRDDMVGMIQQAQKGIPNG